MPKYDGEPQLVAMLLSLMMGWVSSPPTFCAASETAANITNASLFCNTMLPHQLEDTASAHDCWGLPQLTVLGPQAPFSPMTAKNISELPQPLPQPEDHALLMRHQGPIAHMDIFVNDFIKIAQSSQHFMHAVDKIFLQLDAMTAQHKESISKKKLLKGGGWSQWKEILGWILNTGQGTLELTKWCKKPDPQHL